MGASDWLTRLKVGDHVLAIGRGGEAVRRVQRLTATLIVLDNGDRFSRKHGSSTGTDAWTAVHLAEATPEQVERIRTEAKRQRLARALSHRNWSNLPLSVLEQVFAVLAYDGCWDAKRADAIAGAAVRGRGTLTTDKE